MTFLIHPRYANCVVTVREENQRALMNRGKQIKSDSRAQEKRPPEKIYEKNKTNKNEGNPTLRQDPSDTKRKNTYRYNQLPGIFFIRTLRFLRSVRHSSISAPVRPVRPRARSTRALHFILSIHFILSQYVAFKNTSYP